MSFMELRWVDSKKGSIASQVFFLEMYFRGRNCFCGERKSEKDPAGHLAASHLGGLGACSPNFFFEI